VFDYILGIPAHPLIVHFAIVFLVLLVAGAAIYALVPPVRPRIWWAVAGLAIAGPLGAWFAKMSGEKLFNMFVAQKYPKEIMDQVNTHLSYGKTTLNYSLGLGAATLVLVLVSMRLARGDRAAIPAGPGDGSVIGNPPAPQSERSRGSLLATVGLSLVVLVLAGFTGYYTFKTGDTGAHAVWGNFKKP
jgi:uncharacterized membrane protein